jgi:hypothetical protein
MGRLLAGKKLFGKNFPPNKIKVHLSCEKLAFIYYAQTNK